MSFHCKHHSRLFCDKAVQTEPLAAIPRVTDPSGSLESSRAVFLPGIADQAIDELLSRSGSAYKHSNTSGVSVSSLSESSANGKTWLDYGYPSWSSRVIQRRVVSHPDSVTCETKALYANSGRTRVVSLPEQVSLGTITRHQLQDPEGQSPYNREYPTDLPQTPSPPSSPDSVVIVGNETHVPSSFFQAHVDENGWTTWANSPPRPIPALHGPSSLPYARCPSGAEGTVVEGDDLATKVWGLGSDEGHRLWSKSPQPLGSSASYVPLLLDVNNDYQRVTSSAMARHRDAVIDLAKLSTVYCHPGANECAGHLEGTYSSLAGHPGRLNLYAYSLTSQDMQSDHVATKGFLNQPALGKESVSRIQSLPQTLRPTALSGHSNLNSAAASFVPSRHTGNTDSESACTQQGTEIGDSEYSPSGRDPTTLGQQDASDLTPSSTASPLWSPVFQSVPIIVLGDHNPRIYSPQTDMDPCSDKFTAQKMNTQEFIPVQQRLRAEQDLKSSFDTFYTHPYVASNAIYLKGATDAAVTHLPTLSQKEKQESHDRPRHLSHRPSRSIPMGV